MGKTNKKRGHSKGIRGEAMVNPVTNECISEDMEDDRSDYLGGFLDAICNVGDDGQKECSLATIANLVQEKEAILKLLKKGIVKKLGPLLADANLQIKEKVAGTFRNMSVVGGAEACEAMVKSDIMTCIGYSVKKDFPELEQLAKCGNTGEHSEKLSACLKELVILLWNLCESSSTAVKLVNKDQLVIPLSRIIYAGNLDPELIIASAQCLCTVTEDNKDAVMQLVNDTALLEKFAEIMQQQKVNGKQTMLAVVITGIMYNLRNSLPENVCDQLINETMNIVSVTLEIKSSDTLSNMSEKEENKVENLLSYLSAQQMCLELLANLLCSNDEEEWEEMGDIDENELAGNVEEMEINVDMDSGAKSNGELPIFKLLIEKSIPTKILSFINHPNKESFSVIKDTALVDRVLEASQRVQTSALVCFNNLLSECPVDVIGDVNCLETVWTKVINLGTEQNGSLINENSEDLIDGLTGLLRAIAVKMGEINDYRFLTPQSLQIFEEWYNRITADSSKCNLLKILGVGGKLIAEKESYLPVLEAIGRILCSAVKVNNSVVVICEALDAVFDAFAENGIPDKVLGSSGLAQELCMLPPLLKAKVKAEKHKVKEHLPLIDMSRTNLVRFIKYKQWK